MVDLSPHTFRALAGIIHHESGMVLGLDKSYLVRHRLGPLLASSGLTGYDELVTHLNRRDARALRNSVIDAITVKETRFFRDHACFDAFTEIVLPEFGRILAAKGKGRQQVRIWSAATATGQEAYSLAMCVREFTRDKSGPDAKQFTILGSDISAAAIATAMAGKYTTAEVRRGVTDARVPQHFQQRNGIWQVNDAVRQLVQFRTFNLLRPLAEISGGGAFDLIFCRNVMIYFDEATRRRICRDLYAALQPGGWLMLGSAEGLYGAEDRFETTLHGKAILYRKPSLKNTRAP